MGAARSRDRLNRVIHEQEESYLQLLAKVADIAEKLKKDKRERKDERKREFEEFRAKLELDAAKFAGVMMMCFVFNPSFLRYNRWYLTLLKPCEMCLIFNTFPTFF